MRLYIGTATVLAILIGALVLAHPCIPQGSGALTVVVKESDGDPVEDALVELIWLDGTQSCPALIYTDGLGEADFGDDLILGNYQIIVSKRGYVSVVDYVTLDSSERRRHIIVAG